MGWLITWKSDRHENAVNGVAGSAATQAEAQRQLEELQRRSNVELEIKPAKEPRKWWR
jgi:hypothetical protein